MNAKSGHRVTSSDGQKTVVLNLIRAKKERLRGDSPGQACTTASISAPYRLEYKPAMINITKARYND